MVGRTVRAAVRRLCGIARGSIRICRGGCGFRAGRRFHLGRSAGCGNGAGRCRADDPTGACRDVRKSQSRTGIAPDMKRHPIAILACWLSLTAGAMAQVSLAPPPGAPTPLVTEKPAAKPKPKAPAVKK